MIRIPSTRPTRSVTGCSTASPRRSVERGYRDTTVADIVRHARTSKRTFYEQFASKEECLIELLRRNNEDLIANIQQRPSTPRRTGTSRSARRSTRTSTTSRSRPAITLSWIREAPALGVVARPLHRLAMEQLTDMLVDLSDSPGFRRAQICRRSPARWR